MKLFGPTHTPESVAADLIRGLEDGSLSLGTIPEPTEGVSRADIAQILAEMAEALAELPQPTAQAVLRDLYGKILGALGDREPADRKRLLGHSETLLNS